MTDPAGQAAAEAAFGAWWQAQTYGSLSAVRRIAWEAWLAAVAWVADGEAPPLPELGGPGGV